MFRFFQQLLEADAWYFAPLSWVYAFFVFLRNQLYDFHLLPITKVNPVVVSVGNVQAGGTGKTPFVHLLAKQFPHRKIAILSRGYGPVADEAILHAKKLPDVKVWVGKNRAKLAQNIDADLLILDDGFQHRKLHRDFDIVLGGGEGHYLPRGFLRDSPSRLKKADAEFSLGKELFLKPKHPFDLKGKEVGIFCAIAKPKEFQKTVESLGAKIVATHFFFDHEVPDLSRLDPKLTWVCTEKDAVKLPKTDLSIYVLEVEMEFVSGAQRFKNLIEKIDRTIDNRSRL